MEVIRGISEKAMATHSSTLAWKIPWTEEPGGLQSVGSLSQTQLSDFTSTFHFHALEKEMATHSSVLAWRIPGTGEPGGLLSMGSRSRTRLKQLSSSSSLKKKRCFSKWFSSYVGIFTETPEELPRIGNGEGVGITIGLSPASEGGVLLSSALHTGV